MISSRRDIRMLEIKGKINLQLRDFRAEAKGGEKRKGELGRNRGMAIGLDNFPAPFSLILIHNYKPMCVNY